MGAGPPLVSYLSSDPRYPAVFDRLVERIYSVLPGVPAITWVARPSRDWADAAYST